MKKMIMIGKSGGGKTTLCQRMHQLELDYRKTQGIDLYENVIDTPGEYIENRFYYKALIVTAAEADVIALVQDCTEAESSFPPLFGGVFPKPVIGIVTKADLVEGQNEIEQAKEFLVLAGAEKVFVTSAMDGSRGP
ncbi:MAG: EutP/PduV family microcompartment system protein [Bacillus sp. (in: Bacteria)]|nr:EutP/PduV family microcompartment system protein [Bacillus sp. (in: firmicutes)]